MTTVEDDFNEIEKMLPDSVPMYYDLKKIRVFICIMKTYSKIKIILGNNVLCKEYLFNIGIDLCEGKESEVHRFTLKIFNRFQENVEFHLNLYIGYSPGSQEKRIKFFEGFKDKLLSRLKHFGLGCFKFDKGRDGVLRLPLWTNYEIFEKEKEIYNDKHYHIIFIGDEPKTILKNFEKFFEIGMTCSLYKKEFLVNYLSFLSYYVETFSKYDLTDPLLFVNISNLLHI